MELDEPEPGEVMVRLVATGVCHTDILARDQNIPFVFPGVLGHEGAGVVEAIGDGVTKVEEGDHVVLTWPSCGECSNCIMGQPRYCLQMRTLAFSGGRPNGSTAFHRGGHAIHDHFFGQSSFSTRTITWERNVVKVPREAPLELLGPLGCGVASGAGAILNALRPPVGSSIAIFGAGSVGLSAVMAAKLSGCTTIVVVDLVGSRLDLAVELGATHTVNAAKNDAVEAVREVSGGAVDFSLECAGNVSVLRQAVAVLPIMRGVCGLVGGTPPGTDITLDHKTMLYGKRLQGILGGEGQGDIFIPQLVDLHAKGLFPMERLVRYFDLSDVNEAVSASEDGSVLKPILRMPK